MESLLLLIEGLVVPLYRVPGAENKISKIKYGLAGRRAR